MLTHIKLTLSRLYLRTVDVSYAEEILEYQKENRDFLAPFEAQKEPEFFTKAYQKALIRQENAALRQLRGFDFWIFEKESHKILGKITVFSILEGNFSMCMVGYKLHKDYLNKGYMTEALMGVVNFLFKDMLLHRVEINILTDNIASQRVAEKAGFTREGISPKFASINGEWRDHVRFARINPDSK